MYQGGHPGSVGECISLASQGKGPCYQCLDLNPGLGSLADWEKAARKGQRWFPPFDGSGKALRSSSWQDENAWIGIRVSHKVDCPLRECSIDAQCPWASQCIDDLCTAVIEEVKKCVCFPFAVKKTEDLCVTMPDMERPCDDGTFCKDEHCQVGCKDSQVCLQIPFISSSLFRSSLSLGINVGEKGPCLLERTDRITHAENSASTIKNVTTITTAPVPAMESSTMTSTVMSAGTSAPMERVAGIRRWERRAGSIAASVR